MKWTVCVALSAEQLKIIDGDPGFLSYVSDALAREMDRLFARVLQHPRWRCEIGFTIDCVLANGHIGNCISSRHFRRNMR